MRSQDTQAEQITFGVELETTIPATSGVTVGGYHCGAPVRGGNDTATNQPLTAPTFNGNLHLTLNQLGMEQGSGQRLVQLMCKTGHQSTHASAFVGQCQLANEFFALPEQTGQIFGMLQSQS